MTLNVSLDGTYREPQPTPELCTVINNTVMHCPTPTIDPSILSVPGGRRRRDIDTLPLLDEIVISLEGIEFEDKGRTRTKRQALNSQFQKFEIGFILDGLPTYTNVTEELGMLMRVLNFYISINEFGFQQQMFCLILNINVIIEIQALMT